MLLSLLKNHMGGDLNQRVNCFGNFNRIDPALIQTIWQFTDMVRKGKLAEILSKAVHADNSELYMVAYRDFVKIKEVSLSEFLKLSEGFQLIPASRIVYIKRLNETLYKKIFTCNL